MKRGGFASIGECMIELSGIEDDRCRFGFAGDALNTAWYVRALVEPACPVDYVSAFGDDDISNRQRAFLSKNGIGTAQSPVIKGLRPGLYAITLDGAERSFTYWRNQSAARHLARDRAALTESLTGRDMIYWSGITLQITLPEDREALIDCLRASRASGAKIAFDPNFRAQLWPDVALARELMREAAGIADIVLPTLGDEQALFGDRDAAACQKRLAAWGVDEIVIKDGENPVLVSKGDMITVVPTQPVRTVDTTGAGDSFNGGYLAGRLADDPPSRPHAKASMSLLTLLVSGARWHPWMLFPG